MSKPYNVRFHETIYYNVTVEAADIDAAIAQVREMFESGAYVHEDTTAMSDYVAEETGAPPPVTEDQIAAAKATLCAAGYISDYWHESDVQILAEDILCRELTPAELESVKQSMSEIDANVGLNWESIQSIIENETQEGAA